MQSDVKSDMEEKIQSIASSENNAKKDEKILECLTEIMNNVDQRMKQINDMVHTISGSIDTANCRMAQSQMHIQLKMNKYHLPQRLIMDDFVLPETNKPTPTQKVSLADHIFHAVHSGLAVVSDKQICVEVHSDITNETLKVFENINPNVARELPPIIGSPEFYSADLGLQEELPESTDLADVIVELPSTPVISRPPALIPEQLAQPAQPLQPRVSPVGIPSPSPVAVPPPMPSNSAYVPDDGHLDASLADTKSVHSTGSRRTVSQSSSSVAPSEASHVSAQPSAVASQVPSLPAFISDLNAHVGQLAAEKSKKPVSLFDSDDEDEIDATPTPPAKPEFASSVLKTPIIAPPPRPVSVRRTLAPTTENKPIPPRRSDLPPPAEVKPSIPSRTEVVSDKTPAPASRASSLAPPKPKPRKLSATGLSDLENSNSVEEGENVQGEPKLNDLNDPLNLDATVNHIEISVPTSRKSEVQPTPVFAPAPSKINSVVSHPTMSNPVPPAPLSKRNHVSLFSSSDEDDDEPFHTQRPAQKPLSTPKEAPKPSEPLRARTTISNSSQPGASSHQAPATEISRFEPKQASTPKNTPSTRPTNPPRRSLFDDSDDDDDDLFKPKPLPKATPVIAASSDKGSLKQQPVKARRNLFSSSSESD